MSLILFQRECILRIANLYVWGRWNDWTQALRSYSGNAEKSEIEKICRSNETYLESLSVLALLFIFNSIKPPSPPVVTLIKMFPQSIIFVKEITWESFFLDFFSCFLWYFFRGSDSEQMLSIYFVLSHILIQKSLIQISWNMLSLLPNFHSLNHSTLWNTHTSVSISWLFCVTQGHLT